MTLIRNKIGFHTGVSGNPTGIGDYVRALDAAGIPAFIVSADGTAGLSDIFAMWDNGSQVNHHALYRIVKDGSEQYAVPDYSLSPSNAAQKHWNLIKPLFPPEIQQRKDKVWILPVNELDKTRSNWIGAFCMAISDLALHDGYRVALPAWSGGEPEKSDWETDGMLSYLEYCQEHPDTAAIALHEYSWVLDDILRGGGSLVGRFEWLLDICNQNNIAWPKIFITEWGWAYNDVPEPSEAISQIVQAMQTYYARYECVQGCAIWWLGGGFGGIANKVQKLIQPVTDLTLNHMFDVELEEPSMQETLNQFLWRMGRAQQTVSLNKDAALQKTMTGTGISPVGSEKWVTYSPTGDRYAVQPADNWQDGEEYVYYAKVPLWDDIHVLTEDDTLPDPVNPLDGIQFGYLFDVPYVVTSRFNDARSYGKHEGTDYDVLTQGDSKEPVLAIYDGVVVRSINQGGYGNHVVVESWRNNSQFYVWYSHLDARFLQVGQSVKKGVAVGEIGDTGNVTGEHVHITLQVPGFGLSGYVVSDVVNPEPLIPIRSQSPTIDILQYMRGDGRQYELQYTWAGGGTHPCQTQSQSIQFFIVKGGGEYEGLYHDANYIYRDIDTSEAPDKFYVQKTGSKVGAIWVKRHMRIGETITKNPHIVHYWQRDCSIRAEGDATDKLTLTHHYDEFHFESGIILNDVIRLEWNHGEAYFFARDFGLVGFEFGGGKSYISEVHQGRPDLQRTKPPCIDLSNRYFFAG